METETKERTQIIIDRKVINILLLEDDAGDVRLVERNLAEFSEHVKFAVESVGSLSDAIECLTNREYDIVLSDLGLPDSSGIETVQKLKQVIPGTPIVVLTGVDDEEIGLSAIRNGASDYLVKGLPLKVLLVRSIRYALEHSNAEKEVKALRQQLEFILGASKTGIDIIDSEFNIRYINSEWKKAYGDPSGKKCYEYFMDRSEMCPGCGMIKALKTKKPVVTEEVLVKEGNRPIQVTTIPFQNEKEEWLVAEVHVDITERKKAEEQLKEMMKLKSEFTSMVSHELRTPLTAIKGGIAFVLNGLAGDINEEQKEMLGIAKKNVDRLARLINDVLDFQKLDSGKMKFNLEANDINQIVKDVYETMASSAKATGLDILLELDQNLPKAKFDSDKITQVLTNLVNNAMKFTEKGNITIKTSKTEDEVQVSVSDTGCGIKQENLPRLFHKFQQLEKKGERKTGGTGLGLAISKEIIEKHNGKIWAESQPDRGSTFFFTLPTTDAAIDLKLEKGLVKSSY